MENHILTPPSKKTPRINGARIFGVRPGNPFMFKIAATGEKPLSYTAENLPAGLSIDPFTGIIKGTVIEPGSYPVRIKVSNSHGTAARECLIKVSAEICLTPPMGWNSWYCHSELISEEAIRETARAMVDTGLIDHGWTYINIDDCWQGVRGGVYNAIQPNERFKDMKGLCSYLHSLGLKTGIYSTPWIGTYAGFIGGSATNEHGDYSKFYLPEEKRLQPHQFFGRAPGIRKKRLNHVGSYWFFDRDAAQWADWGFDYVKVDWYPNDVSTTKRITADLLKCKRDIVLSLSNRTPYKNAKKISSMANCWRTTGDIQDNWRSISRIGYRQKKWQPLTHPGHWNDPDMLQVGLLGIPNRQNSDFQPTHLSPDEQYSQMSLWCLLSAPLLLSCDITSLDQFTLSLLTNDEVLEINQDPAGNPAFGISRLFKKEIWAKQLEDGTIAVGLFNRSMRKREVTLLWKDLGLEGSHQVRDLWRQQDLGIFTESFTVEVNPHGVVLIKMSTNTH